MWHWIMRGHKNHPRKTWLWGKVCCKSGGRKKQEHLGYTLDWKLTSCVDRMHVEHEPHGFEAWTTEWRQYCRLKWVSLGDNQGGLEHWAWEVCQILTQIIQPWMIWKVMARGQSIEMGCKVLTPAGVIPAGYRERQECLCCGRTWTFRDWDEEKTDSKWAANRSRKTSSVGYLEPSEMFKERRNDEVWQMLLCSPAQRGKSQLCLAIWTPLRTVKNLSTEPALE